MNRRAALLTILAGGGAAAPVIPWYLSGGVAAVNCIGAYQAEGSASYAVSKINLANPGTFDLQDGTAAPSWDALNGWSGNGSTEYLKTGVHQEYYQDPPTVFHPPDGIAPNSGWSAVVKYSNAITQDSHIFGVSDTSGRGIGAWTIYPDGHLYPYNGASNGGEGGLGLASGVLVIAGQSAYLNGTLVSNGNLPAWVGGVADVAIAILAQQLDGSVWRYSSASIQYIAFYDIVLDADQEAAIRTAINP